MNCLEYRQERLAGPTSQNPEAKAHLEECEACTKFDKEVSDLDSKVLRAMSVEVPEGLAARILLKHSLQRNWRVPTRRLWLSLAASIFAISVVVYQYRLPEEIMEPLLAHAQHQAHEFYGAEHSPISNDKLKALMATLKVEGSLENVVYAAVCPVDGEQALHLVIKDGEDQYTVMLIPDRSPSKVFVVDNDVWRGYISPHPAGALAVLAAANHPDAIARIREVSQKYQNSLYLAAEI